MEVTSFRTVSRKRGTLFVFRSTPQLYRFLQIYLIFTVTINLSFLFFNGYGGDLGYWNSWVKQLSKNGYEGFNGNYPPVYIHWLYLVGQFYIWLDMPIEKNILLKFFVQLPIILAHYIFVCYAFCKLKRFGWSSPWFHLGLCLAAFNPAIIWNGPMWGQVDLLPIMFVLFAFECCFSRNKKHQLLMFPLYALALLAKFQMIAFLPILGFLFFRNILLHLVGFVISVFLIVIAFSPWLIIGEFTSAVTQAYISTLGQYPYSTYNAANIWMLLAGNVSDDSRQIISFGAWSWLERLGEVKYLGMFIFSTISLAIFFKGGWLIYRRCSNEILRSEAFYAALLSALAFFAFLPAMHERYIFPAVVLSAACAFIKPRLIPLSLVISALSSMNMAVLLGINGSNLWFGMSIAVVIAACLVLISHFLSAYVICQLWGVVWDKILARRYVAAMYSFVAILSLLYIFVARFSVVHPDLAENERLLTSFPMIDFEQDHGQPKFNRNYEGKTLSVGGRRYAKGIGTHSDSELIFELPDNASKFIFFAGLDDTSKKSDVKFIVKADGVIVWQSDVVYAQDWFLEKGTLEVSNVNKLSLVVDKVTDDKWDHANWINPIIILSDE